MKKKILGLFLLAFCCVGLAACGKEGVGEYTYNTYTAVSPSNWNELTYQDNNDTQIMSYIGSSFFTYDFKFDNEGKPIPGEFEIKYQAATKLEDVTTTYAGDKKYAVPEKATSGFAYKITLRDDLTWDDGTPIKAEDFVYTMQQQLDPLFKNYRADSFYVGSTVIHKAKDYVYQGSHAYSSPVISENMGDEEYFPADTLHDVDGVLRNEAGNDFQLKLTSGGNWGSNGLADYAKAGHLAIDKDGTVAPQYTRLAEAADEEGNVILTEALLKDLQDCIAILHRFADVEAYAEQAGDYAYLEWQEMAYLGMDFPKVDFSEVGIFVGSNELELVIVLDKELNLLKDDGSLSYKAAYNMSSLPLVKKDLYEANKKAPVTGSTLWTSTYNSSVETTASWGPYKLVEFQAGKQYTLVKNDKWFGYNMPENEGLYQTTKISCETLKEWNSAWLKFQAGEIDGIGIDVSIAQDYKGSERAYYTPDDSVASLQLQSSKEALKGRESEGVNKTILAYTDFRKALSLGINRAEFAKSTTTSSLAGFGLFNSMHYYDVANGGVYRNTDVAKQVLCDVYAVNVEDYESLDAAEAAITGYNLEEARKLVTKAYNEALEAGDIKETDKVVLTFGTGAINEVVTRRFDFIKASWTELVKTTPLEGRLEFEVVDKATEWADDFRDGGYDVCMGGWTGAAWDPGYFLLAYLSPAYMYSKAWDTSKAMLTFTMPGVGENGADVTDTLSLIDWYNCLNGATGAKYNWGTGAVAEEKRLILIAALEKEVLSVYYTVPLYNNYGASLLSYKVEYITYEYNTFMSYGGIKYMTYNYDDYDWAQFVSNHNGQIDYTA